MRRTIFPHALCVVSTNQFTCPERLCERRDGPGPPSPKLIPAGRAALRRGHARRARRASPPKNFLAPLYFPFGAFFKTSEPCGVRFLLVTSAVLLFGASSFARLGVLRTLTGQTLEGHVRLTPGQVVVVNAERRFVSSVELTNLARISFPASAPAPAADDSVNES